MTKRECAVIMSFTGVAMLKGDDLDIFYQYLADVMGRPIFSHEIAILADEIKESARPDFIRICREAAAADETINLSEVADCDQFICKECGINLTNWERVDGNMWAEEYEFKFCPNCGRKVRGYA